MVILLNDEGWGTAINITGILSADSDEISIQNPTMNFDDAFPGMPIVNDSSPYEVELSSTIQPGEYEFILTLTANEVDGIGYDSIFYMDHTNVPQWKNAIVLDPWVMLSSIAAVTNHVELEIGRAHV